jgi:hypothetical protein
MDGLPWKGFPARKPLGAEKCKTPPRGAVIPFIAANLNSLYTAETIFKSRETFWIQKIREEDRRRRMTEE